MKKLDKYVIIFFNYIPGGIFGLLSVILAVIFVFLSYIHFPGYDMMNNDVSLLGIGPGLSAPLFNNGLKIIGITAIPFFIYFGRILKQEVNSTQLINRAVRLSIVGCISLSLIGFFPVVDRTMGMVHAGLALIFFLCSIINLVYFSIAILKDERFSKNHAYLGFIITILIAFYIAVRLSIVEWIVFFAIGFWITDISIYILYKKFSIQ